jgi:uncharacterized protein (DUF362 family)
MSDRTKIGRDMSGGDQPDRSNAESGAEARPEADQASLGPLAAKLDRRALLLGAGVAAAGVAAFPLVRKAVAGSSPVFIARNQSYDGPLEQTIRDGLSAAGVNADDYKGRRVLLKPNMVEPMRGNPQMTTNPRMVVAVAEIFRRAGASVTVGEAPGHVRDTEMALVESRMADALLDAKLPFADLNYEESRFVRNGGGLSQLAGFYFPRSVAEADLIVSMPKMKTHHWVGVTMSMKNLYGTLPGNRYGWPKNVLHHAGIPQTVVDINASLPKTIAVVDGIECMEGDGPILGSSKMMGLVMVGADRLAVDATAARIMGFDPQKLDYMRMAHDLNFGRLNDWQIRQRGEAWEPLYSPFKILDKKFLRAMQTKEAAEKTS